MDTGELFCEEIVQWASDDNVEEEDALLLAASDDYERSTTATPTSPAPAARHHLRFAPPQSEQQIQGARIDGIPEATKKDTKYCLKIWEQWSKQRHTQTNTPIPPLTTMPTSQLSYWLIRFVLEARKRNGEPYPPNSLHHIVMGVVRHLRWCGRSLDVIKDVEFQEFRATLDSEMKRLQSAGLGSSKRQAEVISVEEEETLWHKGFLGDSTPQVLLDTIVASTSPFVAARSIGSYGTLPVKLRWCNGQGREPT